MLKRIDRYIIKKFLGTYIGSLSLFILIAIMCDVNENLDDFIKYHIPFKAVVLEHYMMFIPWFLALFSSLFVFISVIFFTSKLADSSEVIAIFAGGISLHRLMIPYMVSAFIISSLNFCLNSYIIPKANEIRQEFVVKYMNKGKKKEYARNIQLKISPDVVAYMESFDSKIGRGYHFSLEYFPEQHLSSKLTAESITYDSLNHWTIHNYKIRDLSENVENIVTGNKMDTMLYMNPDDLIMNKGTWEVMTSSELREYIIKQTKRGIGGVEPFIIELEKRRSLMMTAFILTTIGVSISCKKVKGGMGMNIGLGLLLAAFYILFLQISSMFAIGGAMSPRLAVWIPNIIFTFVAIYLYRRAEK
ncbi:MAG TPA: hypothetical protein DDY68_03320 [Porphyromonadaceae bacterium]|nr:hypothetical protein [Porphyromonadaceae bacterium]